MATPARSRTFHQAISADQCRVGDRGVHAQERVGGQCRASLLLKRSQRSRAQIVDQGLCDRRIRDTARSIVCSFALDLLDWSDGFKIARPENAASPEIARIRSPISAKWKIWTGIRTEYSVKLELIDRGQPFRRPGFRASTSPHAASTSASVTANAERSMPWPPATHPRYARTARGPTTLPPMSSRKGINRAPLIQSGS